MALVFRHSAEEPARCALEIAEALQKHPELPVRMGIHSGPVSEVTDVSGRTNIAGAGINMAQRVMDCGDAGHILLSQHVADDLVQFAAMGAASARPGRVRGQARRPAPFGQSLRRAAGQRRSCRRNFSRRVKPTPTRRSSAGLIAALASSRLLVAGAVAAVFTRASRRGPTRSPPLPGKVHRGASVRKSERATKRTPIFTDGVQDEILTDLAQIADLKVISRTSRDAVQERRAAQSARDRPATRRGTCRRRQCAARGQQSAGERAVDRCPHRRASLGANLRSRSGRCLRHPKRNRQGDCRSVAGEALA